MASAPLPSDESPKDPPIPISGYITDLSEDKIRLLKQDDLDRMIMLKMASHGIQIIEKPQPVTLHEIPEKDVTLYTVKGVSFSFVSIEDAQKVAALMAPMAMHMRRNNHFYGDPVEEIGLKEYGEEPFTIKPEKVYSRSLWAEIARAIRENKELESEYKKKLKEYEDAHKEAEWIRDEVMDRYNEVREKYEALDRLVVQYETYLSVAEGNDDFAWKFLKKAFTIDPESEAYIRAQVAAKAK